MGVALAVVLWPIKLVVLWEDAALQSALRFLGGRGYQLWAGGPGQGLGPCCVFSSTVGRAESILEATPAHTISDALSSVSLFSLCSWLALFQSRFPSSSPLFARPLFLSPSPSQAVTHTSIVFLSGSLKPSYPGVICPQRWRPSGQAANPLSSLLKPLINGCMHQRSKFKYTNTELPLQETSLIRRAGEPFSRPLCQDRIESQVVDKCKRGATERPSSPKRTAFLSWSQPASPHSLQYLHRVAATWRLERDRVQ